MLNPALAAAILGVSAWQKLMYSLIWQSVTWRPGKLRFLIGVKNPLPIRPTAIARKHGPFRGRVVRQIRTSVGLRPPFVAHPATVSHPDRRALLIPSVAQHETVLPSGPECVTSPEAGSLEGKAGSRPILDGPIGEAKSASKPHGSSTKCVSICEHCGSPFRPRRSWSTFCSPRCRVAAHRRGKLADGHSGTKPGAGDQDNRLPASASDVGPTPDFTEPAAEAA